MADEPVAQPQPAAAAPAADPAAKPAPAPAPAPAAAPATPAAPVTTVVTDPAKPAAASPAAGSPEAIAAEKTAAEAVKTAARDAAIKAGVLEVAPEKYEDFKIPDGMKVDAKILTEAQPVLKELGLSQASAQKVIDLYATKIVPALVAQQAEALESQSKAWEAAVKADKELGGDKFAENLEVAKSTLSKFGSPELVKLLNDSRLGNHPEVVRFFHKVGRAMSEDNIGGAGGGGENGKDAASVLYPGMK